MTGAAALALLAVLAAQDPCIGAPVECRRAAAQAVRDFEIALAVTESSHRRCLDRLAARTPTAAVSLAAVRPDPRGAAHERDAALVLAGAIAGILAGVLAVSVSR